MFESRPSCTNCDLREGIGLNGHVGVPSIRLPGLEPGPEHRPLVFIGMNPGAVENEKNEPFVGKSGDLLRRVLIEGFSLRALSTVYLMNAARCFTAPNSPPKDKHYVACFPWLLEDLALVYAIHQQPVIVCALGAGPVKIVTKQCLGARVGADLKKAIQKPARLITAPNGVPLILFAAFHPAYILRNQPAIHAACDQFALLRDYLTGGLPEPSEPTIVAARGPRRDEILSSLRHLPPPN